MEPECAAWAQCAEMCEHTVHTLQCLCVSVKHRLIVTILSHIHVL